MINLLHIIIHVNRAYYAYQEIIFWNQILLLKIFTHSLCLLGPSLRQRLWSPVVTIQGWNLGMLASYQSELEFVECFESHVVSVDHFQLENSGFFCNGWAIVNSSVLIIEDSTASLDRVVFTSAVENCRLVLHLIKNRLTTLCACLSTVNCIIEFLS